MLQTGTGSLSERPRTLWASGRPGACLDGPAVLATLAAMTRLVVVGFGLIGGSFALAQRRAESGLEVTAIDRAAVLDAELVQGATERQIDVTDVRNVERSL